VKRLAVTVLGLVLYAVLERISRPRLAPAEPGMPQAAILRSRTLAVGMMTLIASFVLVELQPSKITSSDVAELH
jgi:hypothetical protein